MNRQDFRLSHRLRVRWAEVDMQKIVFNAHYLMYFDTAITDYWRALGLPFEEAMHQLGGELYVKKASVEYHGSAHFDDVLDVVMKCSRIGNSSLIFSGSIFRGAELLITCELVYVFADPASQTSRPVPQALRRLIERFEAGESVLEIKVGDWIALQQDLVKVRTTVFTQDQGKVPATESDNVDNLALHAVAYNGLGQAVATGRLSDFEAALAKIERIEVHRALRGSGVGRSLLQALIDAAKQRGHTEVTVHSPYSVKNFYQRQGLVVRRDGFDVDGIPHVEMVRAL